MYMYDVEMMKGKEEKLWAQCNYLLMDEVQSSLSAYSKFPPGCKQGKLLVYRSVGGSYFFFTT